MPIYFPSYFVAFISYPQQRCVIVGPCCGLSLSLFCTWPTLKRGKTGGEEKGIVNRVRLFIAVNGDSPAARILSWAARMGAAEAKVFQQTAMSCWTPGKKKTKKKDFLYIRPESSHLSRRRATQHTGCEEYYIKGGEGIMKEERLSSTSSWSVSSCLLDMFECLKAWKACAVVSGHHSHKPSLQWSVMSTHTAARGVASPYSRPKEGRVLLQKYKIK